MLAQRRSALDGLSQPFQIGLRPLDPEDWILVDERLAALLAEKQRVREAYPDAVFVAEPGTEAAQAEVLGLLAEYLPRRFPRVYRRQGSHLEIVPAGRSVDLADTALPSLQLAAGLVREDLMLMRRGEAGWRLAAGALDFPTSWSLRHKFGRPMHEVHAPVPGFNAGTRNAGLIERMFDHLRPEMPVIRWNWSLSGDAGLFHPHPHPPGPRFGDGVFLRIERQTLRRLPASGDIVFAIGLHVDPIEVLAEPGRQHLAAALLGHLETMSEEQARYKGVLADRAPLVARLRAMAGS